MKSETPKMSSEGFAILSQAQKRGLGILAHLAVVVLNRTLVTSSTIMWMMISFFTDQWKFSYTYAARIRNIWSGSILVLPLLLIHVVTTFTGNFYMIACGSVLYTIGLGILSASNPPARCGGITLQVSTCAIKEKMNLYTGLAISAVGLAGVGTSLIEFQAEDAIGRYSGDGPKEGTFAGWCKNMFVAFAFIAFWILTMCMYFDKIKSWHSRFLIAAVFVGIVSFGFIIEKHMYNANTGLPEGRSSTLIVIVLRVLVASTLKLFYRHPGSENLYKVHEETSLEKPLESTRGLRCFDKAAIIKPDKVVQEQAKNRWTLCSVTEVEKAKIMFHMLPLWGTWIILGVVSSMGDSYFQEQANHLDKKLGKLKTPLVALLAFQKLAGFVFGYAFEWTCNKIVLEKYKRARAAIAVALAMVFSILCCIVATKVEKRRLQVVHRAGLIDKPENQIPMTVYLLVPQFMLLGVSETLFNQGSQGFVHAFIPLSMIRYMILSTEAIKGIGRIGNVLFVFLVGKINHRKNRPDWFQATLNTSRLDKYYWVLAQLSTLSFAVYLVVVCWYFYRESKRPKADDGVDKIDHSNFFEDAKCCCL